MVCGASAPNAGNYVPAQCMPQAGQQIHSSIEKCPSYIPPPLDDIPAFTPLPQLTRGAMQPVPGLFDVGGAAAFEGLTMPGFFDVAAAHTLASQDDRAPQPGLQSSPAYMPGPPQVQHSSSAPYTHMGSGVFPMMDPSYNTMAPGGFPMMCAPTGSMGAGGFPMMDTPLGSMGSRRLPMMDPAFGSMGSGGFPMRDPSTGSLASVFGATPAFRNPALAAPLPMPGPLRMPADFQPFSRPTLSLPGPLGSGAWGSCPGAMSPWTPPPFCLESKPFGAASHPIQQNAPHQFTNPLIGGG